MCKRKKGSFRFEIFNSFIVSMIMWSMYWIYSIQKDNVLNGFKCQSMLMLVSVLIINFLCIQNNPIAFHCNAQHLVSKYKTLKLKHSTFCITFNSIVYLSFSLSLWQLRTLQLKWFISLWIQKIKMLLNGFYLPKELFLLFFYPFIFVVLFILLCFFFLFIIIFMKDDNDDDVVIVLYLITRW